MNAREQAAAMTKVTGSASAGVIIEHVALDGTRTVVEDSGPVIRQRDIVEYDGEQWLVAALTANGQHAILDSYADILEGLLHVRSYKVDVNKLTVVKR